MPGSAPPSFLDIGTDLVTLIVGDAQKRHVVHHDLLVKESPYFRAMLQGSWKETANSNEPISLPLADHRVFPYFLNWLYYRRLDLASESDRDIELCTSCHLYGCHQTAPSSAATSVHITDDDDARLESALDFIGDKVHRTFLYIFADKFDVPALREAIINFWWSCCVRYDNTLSYHTVINNFRHLPETSPACRLLVDMHIDKWRADLDDACGCSMEIDLRSKLPSKFLFLLAAGQAKMIAGKYTQALGPLCKYHEHSQDEEAIAACNERTAEMADKGRRRHPDWDALKEERLGVEAESESESEMED